MLKLQILLSSLQIRLLVRFAGRTDLGIPPLLSVFARFLWRFDQWLCPSIQIGVQLLVQTFHFFDV
jgi:hypothetical protein